LAADSFFCSSSLLLVATEKNLFNAGAEAGTVLKVRLEREEAKVRAKEAILSLKSMLYYYNEIRVGRFSKEEDKTWNFFYFFEGAK
jgi:hypothetical protein